MSFESFITPVQATFATVLVLLLLVDLVGNILVIVIYSKNKTTPSPMDFLLKNLAIADAMSGAGIIPWFVFFSSTAHPRGVPGKVLCILFTKGVTLWVGAACSPLLLVAIAFERYFSVIQPHKLANRMSRRTVKFIILFSWLFSIVINAPLVIGIFYSEKHNFCLNKWPSWLSLVVSMTWAMAIGAFPLACLVVLYSRVVYRLWFNKTTSSTQKAIIRHRKRATKVMITVSIIFILSTIPDRIYFAMLSLGYATTTPGSEMHFGAMLLTVINSAANPLVYTIQNKRFRKQLQNLWRQRIGNEFLETRVFEKSHVITATKQPKTGLDTLTLQNTE